MPPPVILALLLQITLLIIFELQSRIPIPPPCIEELKIIKLLFITGSEFPVIKIPPPLKHNYILNSNWIF